MVSTQLSELDGRIKEAKRKFLDSCDGYEEAGLELEDAACTSLQRYLDPDERRAQRIQDVVRDIIEDTRGFRQTRLELSLRVSSLAIWTDLAMADLTLEIHHKAMEVLDDFNEDVVQRILTAVLPRGAGKASDFGMEANGEPAGSEVNDISDPAKRFEEFADLKRRLALEIGDKVATSFSRSALLVENRQETLSFFVRSQVDGRQRARLESVREFLKDKAKDQQWEIIQGLVEQLGEVIGEELSPLSKGLKILRDLDRKFQEMLEIYEYRPRGNIDIVFEFWDKILNEEQASRLLVEFIGESERFIRGVVELPKPV